MVCLVTGSSRGLGKSIALAFGKKKYSVAVHYHEDREGAEGTASEIDDTIILQGDVRNTASVQSLVKSVIDTWGRIDVLINNAGITREALLLKTSDEVFSDVMNTNLKGPVNMIQAAAHHMIDQGNGHIVNISSYAGIKGKQGLSAYSASKAALTGLTKTLARELGIHNIMVNAILPGYMMTDMGSGSSGKAQGQALNDSILKNFSDPENAAEFICYLVSTTGITGQIFNLDSRIF